MAITLRGVAANPGDNTSLLDTVERSITPVPGCVTGDLVYFLVNRKNLTSIAISNTGGQSWNTPTQRQTGSSTAAVFWCRFNGTWSANPSIVSVTDATVVISLYMEVWIPTVGTNTWALDMAERYKAYSAPVSPFDVTALFTNANTTANSTVSFAAFQSIDVNTWGNLTAGWAYSGANQYRNPEPAHNKPISVSVASRMLSAAGALSSPTNRQLTLGGDAGLWITNTFAEQGAGVTIASAGDALFHQGETGIVVTGTSFGASHTGTADIIVSPTNNIADGSAVVQTQTAWSNTSVTFTAVLSSFAYATDLYLFVKSSTGASNSNGFVIRREAIVNMTGVLKNLAGATQNNLTNLQYRVTLSTVNGTLVTSGSNGTTDGSGNFSVPTFYSPNVLSDNVWLSVEFDGASLALSPATLVKLTPTYT